MQKKCLKIAYLLTELYQESPSNEILVKGFSTIAGICLASDPGLYFMYPVMRFYLS